MCIRRLGLGRSGDFSQSWRVGTEAEARNAGAVCTEAEECKARVVGTKAEECKARVGTEARNTPLPPDCPFVPRLECLVHYWNGHPRRIFSPT